MKLNLKETMDALKRLELERIKEELIPHFEDYGNLYIAGLDNNTIRISFKSGVCDYAFDKTILSLGASGYYDNTYDDFYTNTELDINTVFEKIGCFLTEVKIKPIKEFNINEWKQQFVDKHDELLFDDGRVMFGRHKLYRVIDRSNNVNYELWHTSSLEHPKFKFDWEDCVYLETEDDCLEFEQIVTDYITSQKYKTIKQLFPTLSVTEREQLGVKFANIARTLNLDIMYNKKEDDYECNGYNITQDKADMILQLIKGEDYEN